MKQPKRLRCIWCTKLNSDKDIEHIFPEAIGCPKGFHLEGGVVCKFCNNSLAYLDQAVTSEFEIPAFMVNVIGKKNKSPKISSYGNLKGEYINSEKTFFINMDKNKKMIYPTVHVLPPVMVK